MTLVDRLLGRTPHRRKLEAQMEEAVAAVQSLRVTIRQTIVEQATSGEHRAIRAIEALRAELASQPDR